MEKKTYRIPRRNMSALLDEIEKMNRRARRLGRKTIEINEVAVHEHRDKGTGDVTHYHEVEVHGDLPHVEGWRFVAAINHDAASENILKVVPGEKIPDAYRTAEPSCDHCRKDRRRNDTFILVDQSSNFKQVGRNCLADFLRVGTADDLAEYWERFMHIIDTIADAESENYGGGHGDVQAWDLEVFLRHVDICSRAFGWVSASKAYDEGTAPTADIALRSMRPSMNRELNEEIGKFLETNPWTNSNDEFIQKVIAWGKTVDREENDYLYNVGVIAGCEYVTNKTYRIAASMIVAYKRALVIEMRKVSQAATSKHFGTKDERGDFVLTIKSIIPLQNSFGVTNLHIMEDADGNVATWFASNYGGFIRPFMNNSTEKLGPGDVVNIKATVKEHMWRDNVAQTVLTRCKLNEVKQ